MRQLDFGKPFVNGVKNELASRMTRPDGSDNVRRVWIPWARLTTTAIVYSDYTDPTSPSNELGTFFTVGLPLSDMGAYGTTPIANGESLTDPALLWRRDLFQGLTSKEIVNTPGLVGVTYDEDGTMIPVRVDDQSGTEIGNVLNSPPPVITNVDVSFSNNTEIAKISIEFYDHEQQEILSRFLFKPGVRAILEFGQNYSDRVDSNGSEVGGVVPITFNASNRIYLRDFYRNKYKKSDIIEKFCGENTGNNYNMEIFVGAVTKFSVKAVRNFWTADITMVGKSQLSYVLGTTETATGNQTDPLDSLTDYFSPGDNTPSSFKEQVMSQYEANPQRQDIVQVNLSDDPYAPLGQSYDSSTLLSGVTDNPESVYYVTLAYFKEQVINQTIKNILSSEQLQDDFDFQSFETGVVDESPTYARYDPNLRSIDGANVIFNRTADDIERLITDPRRRVKYDALQTLGVIDRDGPLHTALETGDFLTKNFYGPSGEYEGMANMDECTFINTDLIERSVLQSRTIPDVLFNVLHVINRAAGNLFSLNYVASSDGLEENNSNGFVIYDSDTLVTADKFTEAEYWVFNNSYNTSNIVDVDATYEIPDELIGVAVALVNDGTDRAKTEPEASYNSKDLHLAHGGHTFVDFFDQSRVQVNSSGQNTSNPQSTEDPTLASTVAADAAEARAKANRDVRNIITNTQKRPIVDIIIEYCTLNNINGNAIAAILATAQGESGFVPDALGIRKNEISAGLYQYNFKNGQGLNLLRQRYQQEQLLSRLNTVISSGRALNWQSVNFDIRRNGMQPQAWRATYDMGDTTSTTFLRFIGRGQVGGQPMPLAETILLTFGAGLMSAGEGANEVVANVEQQLARVQTEALVKSLPASVLNATDARQATKALTEDFINPQFAEYRGEERATNAIAWAAYLGTRGIPTTTDQSVSEENIVALQSGDLLNEDRILAESGIDINTSEQAAQITNKYRELFGLIEIFPEILRSDIYAGDFKTFATPFPSVLKVTINGISGIKYGESFKTRRIFPKIYDSSLVFTSTIEHRVDKNGWFLTIGGPMIPPQSFYRQRR
ncbi:MAG: hypothetical protein VW683_01545 [Betaproteobacteria bacterium]|jgi:hypothetical protein